MMFPSYLSHALNIYILYKKKSDCLLAQTMYYFEAHFIQQSKNFISAGNNIFRCFDFIVFCIGVYSNIKKSGSESRGQEEAASTSVFRPMRPLQ